MSLRRPSPRLVLLLVVGALALSACGDGADADAVVTRDDLADTTFVATSVTGHDLVAGSELRLTFDGDVLAINAGCNTLTSAWQVEDGTVSWTGEPAQTMMACEPDLADQDTWLVDLFTAGMEASATDDVDLVLSSGDIRIELEEK